MGKNSDFTCDILAPMFWLVGLVSACGVEPCCHCVTVFLQEIKVLRSTVLQRDKERAERATLVAQEKLVRGKVRQANTTVHCSGCTCAPAGSYKFTVALLQPAACNGEDCKTWLTWALGLITLWHPER
jgi:hypothetical protein